jgi:hypothetical protein
MLPLDEAVHLKDLVILISTETALPCHYLDCESVCTTYFVHSGGVGRIPNIPQMSWLWEPQNYPPDPSSTVPLDHPRPVTYFA